MTTIWMDGSLLPLDEARVSPLAHTLHYGLGVFEGIRAYAADDGTAAVFRLEDHLERLERSATMTALQLPFDRDTLRAACLAVLDANALQDGYLRPVAWQDDNTLSGLGSSPTVHMAVSAHAWGAYLGEEGLAKGIRAMIASHRRGSPGSMLSRAKINGQYVISVLAKRHALAQGFDEALLCDDDGHVCEGTGENLFLVEGAGPAGGSAGDVGAVLVTPPSTAPILPGITRDTVLTLARSISAITGIREEVITRERLVAADEVFLTGTAAEVTPVRGVDSQVIGSGGRGPVTAAVQEAFFDLVHGRSAAPTHWRTPFGELVR